MTHTKWPWVVGINDEPTHGIEAIEILAPFGNNGGHICVAYVNGLTDDLKIDTETRSNANLIASSPDLLVALEEMLEMSDTPPERNCSCHINGPCNDCVEYSGLRHARALAEEAIAKARGQS